MIEGSGYMLAGQGVKSGIGGTLIGLGTIGGLSNLGGDKAIEGAIGGAILAGIGGLLIGLDKKKKKQSGKGMKTDFDRYFRRALKNKTKILQSGSGYKKLTAIKKLIEPHLDKPIHIKDILGKDYKKHAKIILQQLNEYQKGSGKVGSFFKKAGESAKSKFKQFLAGKTTIKPSHLLDIAAGAVGIAGAASALIPGVDIISVPAATGAALGLKSTAHLARMAGRGIGGCEGCGGNCHMVGKGVEVFADGTQWADPEMVPDAARKLVNILASQSGPIMSKPAIGAAIGLTGAALVGAYALYKKLKKSKKGSGIKLAGQGLKLAGQGIKIPEKIKNFIETHPEISKKVAKLVESGEKLGSGKIKTLTKILGVGLTVARGAYTLYKFLNDHPMITGMILKTISTATGLPMPQIGSGEKLPYGVKLLPSGKIKKDRYSVYYGYYPKTSSGLTKNDFIKKGKKIISKKKQEQGKKMAKNLIPYKK